MTQLLEPTFKELGPRAAVRTLFGPLGLGDEELVRYCWHGG